MSLWDTSSGIKLRELRGHTQEVTRVVFSPDGKQIATVSEPVSSSEIILWDVASGKQLAKLHGNGKVAFSPDGKQIAIESNYTVYLWDNTGERIAELGRHSSPIRSIAFSPDSKLLATGGQDNTALLWDTTSKQQIGELRGHTDYINKVVFSPDSKLLATVSGDNTVRLWSTTFSTNLAQLYVHTDNINEVVFSPDSKLLVTTSKDSTARLWQVGGIEEMVVLSCNWVQSYFNNSSINLSKEDRHLCDGIVTSSNLQSH